MDNAGFGMSIGNQGAYGRNVLRDTFSTQISGGDPIGCNQVQSVVSCPP